MPLLRRNIALSVLAVLGAGLGLMALLARSRSIPQVSGPGDYSARFAAGSTRDSDPTAATNTLEGIKALLPEWDAKLATQPGVPIEDTAEFRQLLAMALGGGKQQGQAEAPAAALRSLCVEMAILAATGNPKGVRDAEAMALAPYGQKPSDLIPAFSRHTFTTEWRKLQLEHCSLVRHSGAEGLAAFRSAEPALRDTPIPAEAAAAWQFSCSVVSRDGELARQGFSFWEDSSGQLRFLPGWVQRARTMHPKPPDYPSHSL